ncbi:MAG: hypothetical protein FWE03_01485 [Firmicutes bacterium]|nr:hypothetical protein [Bacillota bacterium]
MENKMENNDIDVEIDTLKKEEKLDANEYKDYLFSLKRAGRLYHLKAKEDAVLEKFKDK